MADDLRHPQSAETLPLWMEPPEGLKALAQPAQLVFPAASTAPKAQPPTREDRESEKDKILEPYLRQAPSITLLRSVGLKSSNVKVTGTAVQSESFQKPVSSEAFGGAFQG